MKNYFFPILSYAPLLGAPVERWVTIAEIMAVCRKRNPRARRFWVYLSIWRLIRLRLLYVRVRRGKLVFCRALPF